MPLMPAGDLDKSISTDSVFDWGFCGHSFKGLRGSFASGSAGSSAKHVDSEDKATISRYDLRTMNRITSDLVDVDTDSTESDDEVVVGRVGSNSEKGGQAGTKLLWRQVVIIVSLIGIIVAASVAIGYAIVGGGSAPNERGKPAYSVAGGEGAGTTMSEEDMLELSERIVTACSESSLDEDMSGCQDLCHENMCCFEKDNYNCEEDALKNCPVFGGCEALMGVKSIRR